MFDKPNVQIRFRREDKGIVLQDTLNIPLEEYSKLTSEDLESLKKTRFENHTNHIKLASTLESETIKTPSPEVPLASILEQLELAEEEKKKIDDKINVLQLKVEKAKELKKNN